MGDQRSGQQRLFSIGSIFMCRASHIFASRSGRCWQL